MLLTNLQNYWQFFWLQPGSVVSYTFRSEEAIAFLEVIINETSTLSRKVTPTAVLPTSCEVDEVNAGPVDSLERMLKRPRVDSRRDSRLETEKNDAICDSYTGFLIKHGRG